MKYYYLNAILLLFTCSCQNTSVQEEMLNSAREEFKEQTIEMNKAEIYQIKLDDSLYALAKLGLDTAINAVDKYIMANLQTAHFYYIKGDIYYKYKKYARAKEEYSKAIKIDFVPKYLDARAKCFVDLKKFDSCLADLKSSTEMNQDGNWLLGNFYEVKRDADSAKYFYSVLYNQNRVVYKYCPR